MASDIIPEQETGAQTDITASTEFSSQQEANKFFNEVKQRLLDINNWEKLCGAVTANFILTDAAGNEVDRLARVGDHFKIDIPGPGSLTGAGYDWVEIENIEDKSSAEANNERVAMQVRPSGNPTNSKADVAHFFTNEATSSFIVERSGNKVTASVHGRNEKPNVEAEATVDKTRNAVVALGAMAGFSAAQWKSLVNGLLEIKNTNN